MNAATYGKLVTGEITYTPAPQAWEALEIVSIRLHRFEAEEKRATVATLAEAQAVTAQWALSASDAEVGDGVDFWVSFNHDEYHYQGNFNLTAAHVGGYDLAAHMLGVLRGIIKASDPLTDLSKTYLMIATIEAQPVYQPAPAPVKVQKAPKGKQFAIVTMPDGSVAKRVTERTYTHAIVRLWRGHYDTETYCGSLDLAEKAARRLTGVEIVPVIMSATFPAQ